MPDRPLSQDIFALKYNNMAYIRRAAAPIVTRITGQACNRIVVRPAFARSTLPSASKSSRIGPSHASVRWHSAPASASKVYEYDQIRALSESPSEDRILIGECSMTCPCSCSDMEQTSENRTNIKMATSQAPSTFPSNPNLTLSSSQQKSSKIALASASPNPIRKSCSTASQA